MTYLGDKGKDIEEKTEPASPDTADSLERNLVKGVSVVLPGLAETNVRKADGAPSEKGGKTGEREKPVEHNTTAGAQADVRNGTESNDKDDCGEGTSGLVDPGEDLGGVSLLGKTAAVPC